MPLLDPARVAGLLAEATGRFDVDAADLIDSTNSELMRRAAAGAGSGSVLVADRQSAGRGRRGRSWLSDPETSLTFSVLWRFAGPVERLAGLSLSVGVALAEAVESLGGQGVGLKWPNDVLLRRGDGFAKLAGVLVELSSDRRGTQAVIGIGLNLQAPPADPSLLAASLAEAGAVVERHAVLAALLRALARMLGEHEAAGFAALQTRWQARHIWQDQPVSLIEEGCLLMQGMARGVDAQGALLLETDTGLQSVWSGDVSLRAA